MIEPKISGKIIMKHYKLKQKSKIIFKILLDTRKVPYIKFNAGDAKFK